MMLKQNLPNALTLANLLCGCLAIQQLLAGNEAMVPMLMLLAGVFDFFDGLAARALNVSSPIGKDLDSLADMVTFGVLPSLMAFRLIAEAQLESLLPGEEVKELFLSFPASLALLIAVLSAYRLAKFNHDTRQSSSFIGMPTPGNALFWAGLWIGFHNGTFNMPAPWILAGVAVLTAFLLIAEIPMFSFKLKKLSWKGNEVQLLFLALALPLFIWLKLAALAPFIGLYLLLSIVNMLVNKNEQANLNGGN